MHPNSAEQKKKNPKVKKKQENSILITELII